MRKNLENGISPRLQHITSLFETTPMYFTNILFVHAFELKTHTILVSFACLGERLLTITEDADANPGGAYFRLIVGQCYWL